MCKVTELKFSGILVGLLFVCFLLYMRAIFLLFSYLFLYAYGQVACVFVIHTHPVPSKVRRSHWVLLN